MMLMPRLSFQVKYKRKLGGKGAGYLKPVEAK